ncbi:1-deoxy-D-xylulose-5-phosphate reductoisomerase [Deltaproteobacteria bacterium TL4]
MEKKRLAILGSTGSIGTNTLDILRQHPECFEVIALSCNSQVAQLMEQIREFHPRVVCVGSAETAKALQAQWKTDQLQVLWGQEGLVQIAELEDVETVIAGIVGAAGLPSSYATLEMRKTLALANKETMVLAGELMMRVAKEKNATILPMDSEHNAIFQSLKGHQKQSVEKLILTASGGPFRDKPFENFPQITLEEALNHPNWEMGPKITIDSATMMNKGLEVIEAHWLFDVPVDQIEVLIHRESIIHSMVQYVDGSLIAQLGLPDMRVPIAYCLAYPERLPLNLPKLNLAQIQKLHFAEVSQQKFPCLQLAIETVHMGGGAPAVLNGANEEVVSAFLKGKISFLEISGILTAILNELKVEWCSESVPAYLKHIKTIKDALDADQWGRNRAQTRIEKE